MTIISVTSKPSKTYLMDKDVTVYDCSLINLKKVGDRKGHITFIENNKHIPFPVKRVFYLYDIPGGASRGAHAHKQCHQLIIAASGAFEVLLDDGNIKRQVQINRPNRGLHIPPRIWAQEVNFSSGAICLVLASEQYEETDYIRNYTDFLKIRL